MRTTLRLKVPESLCAGDRNTDQSGWLVKIMGDAADDLLIGFDGVGAVIRAFQRLDFHAPIKPGDFVEVTARIVKWEGNLRYLEFSVNQVITRMENGNSGDGRVLHDPRLVASAEAICEARETESLGTGAPEPLMITVAPVGFDVTRDDTPYIPLSPEEIAADVARSYMEGASIVHLHARSPEGRPVHDPSHYLDIIRRIRAQCDIVIQVTTEGDAHLDVQTRCAHLGIEGVEMASFTAGTINLGEHICFNSKPVMEHTCQLINQHGLLPAVEVYDSAFLENARALAKKGLLKLPGHFVLIFGGKGSMGARSSTIDAMLSLVPRGSRCTLGGRGKHAFPVIQKGLDRGTHVRVGMEDSIHLEGKTLSQGNSPLVARVAEMAAKQGRSIADGAMARKLLGL